MHICIFIISKHWDGACSWNISSWRTSIHWLSIINTMVAILDVIFTINICSTIMMTSYSCWPHFDAGPKCCNHYVSKCPCNHWCPGTSSLYTYYKVMPQASKATNHSVYCLLIRCKLLWSSFLTLAPNNIWNWDKWLKRYCSIFVLFGAS